MNSITIKNQVYNFKEETYKLSEKDSFTIECVKLDFEGKFTNETLLKTIKGVINNEEFNYDTLNKDLLLNLYLRTKENVKLINQCSLKINNKKFFNIIEEFDETVVSSNSSIKISDITDESKKINTNQLLETCLIPTDNKQTNFEYIPIYYYNGYIKRPETPLIVEFNIVINMLINKFPSFKNQLLARVSGPATCSG